MAIKGKKKLEVNESMAHESKQGEHGMAKGKGSKKGGKGGCKR